MKSWGVSAQREWRLKAEAGSPCNRWVQHRKLGTGRRKGQEEAQGLGGEHGRGGIIIVSSKKRMEK